MNVRKHIQQKIAAYMHWEIKSLCIGSICTFSAWSRDMFSQRICTENASL